jgi:kinetochore protein NDC80
MDNRQTLAGLSPGQLNARTAAGAPSRLLKDLKAGGWGGYGAAGGGSKLPLDKVLSRMSLAGPVQRRTSQYVTTKTPAGLRADPRPIGDKSFQQNCVRTVLNYLTTHSYDFPISSKVGDEHPAACTSTCRAVPPTARLCT